MSMNLLNWLTLFSYAALNVDILLETRRIYTTKSSNDLSVIGMTIRFIVVFIVLAKFISLSDQLLIIGQGAIVLTFTGYFALAIHYMRRRHKRRVQRSHARQ